MSNINYSKNNENINTSCKIVRYGKYQETYNGPGDITTKVIKSISIEAFFRLYLELNNVIGYRRMGSEIVDMRLAKTPIDLLIHLMMKDRDYTIVFRNKDATLVKLGKELGKSASSIYATLSKLRHAGYVIKDEDNLLVLNQELTDLITDARKYTDTDEPLKFDFLFKFCVLDPQ